MWQSPTRFVVALTGLAICQTCGTTIQTGFADDPSTSAPAAPASPTDSEKSAMVPGSSQLSVSFRSSLDTITDTELLDHVRFLADDSLEGREANSAGGRAAGDYLSAQVKAMGLRGGGPDGQYSQPCGREMRNILAILPGSDPTAAGETVIVGAHYDHLGRGFRRDKEAESPIYNGANDNASGVAGVLEIAEAMAQLPQAPRRSVLFAFWDGEEKGFLGSRYFVEHPTVAFDGIVFVIALDMIGRINDDHFLFWGTGSAAGLRELISVHNAVPHLDLEFRTFNLTKSDQQPFFVKNIPVLLPSSGLFPELHRPTDDVELINPQGMRRVSQLVCGIVYDLANRKEKFAFAEVARSEADGNPARLADPLIPRSDDGTSVWGFTYQRESREPNTVIVVRVAAGTPAAAAGLQSADRIYRFGDAAATALESFGKILNEPAAPTSLLIERHGRFQTLTLDPTSGTLQAPEPLEPPGDHRPG